GKPGVTQPDREGIVGSLAHALAQNFGAHAEWLAKKVKGLIDEMSSEIEQDTAAFIRIVFPGAPGGTWAPAVQARLNVNQASQQTFTQNFLYGLEFAVQAAVMEWDEQLPLGLGESVQITDLG